MLVGESVNGRMKKNKTHHMAIHIIKYIQDFHEHCIEIFKSNSPKFFDPEELQLFEYYLVNDVEKHYYVVFDDQELLACGGIFSDLKSDQAGLAWGMVHSKHHGKGIGKYFAEYRLNLLKKIYPEKTYCIETSQHTARFYEKLGFTTEHIITDGFGRGIDKYSMKLENLMQ